MLVDLRARAERAGIENVVPAECDAQRLPCPDGTFDAAHLIAVLGEIPDPERTLRELGRVVRSGGRIVVGELFLDPDHVSPSRLRELAERAGLVFASQSGTRLSYFAHLDVR